MLLRRFRRQHVPAGRFLVFVYSDSPNWKEYIETRILPRIGAHAVLLNWSRRSEWRSRKPFEVKIFERWGGQREFNPLAIVIPPKGRVEVIRFWQAFRDAKHGKRSLLEKQEERLFGAVEALSVRSPRP